LRRAAFIDRDGVVIEDVGYLVNPSQLRLLPYAADGIRLLQDRFLIVIVTNQSAVARGLLNEEELLSVHQELAAALYSYKALVDAVYACPHHPVFGVPRYKTHCYCRKPWPGMMIQASHDFDIQLDQSVMIGDKCSDILAGQRASIPVTVLVESHKTGSGLLPNIGPTYTVSNL
jgi:D-glycero-D-manno-heptose 1,7-bisphosphate phosphatase